MVEREKLGYFVERERQNRIRKFLGKVHNEVIENAPRVLRPTSFGFAAASGLERNFIVLGLSLAVGTGSWLILEGRRRAAKKQIRNVNK